MGIKKTLHRKVSRRQSHKYEETIPSWSQSNWCISHSPIPIVCSRHQYLILYFQVFPKWSLSPFLGA